MSMRAELEKVLSQLRYADETRSEAAEQDSICMNEDFLAKYGQELLVACDQMFGPLTGKYGEFLRPFVALMERELFANAGKGDREGWLAMTPQVAMLEIHHHVAKLQKAVLNGDIAGVREYAADVANMSMMAVDVCGALLPAESAQEVPHG